jgi:hypothetical protein
MQRGRKSAVVMAMLSMAWAGSTYATVFSEGFDSGYTDGTNLATYSPNWYGDGGTSSPTIQAGQGVAASVGLSPAKNCFNWSAHAFTWTDPSLTGVIVGMDFQTPAATATGFPFKDDRIGWTINPGSSATGSLFAVELNGMTIEGYYKNASGSKTRTDKIVDIPGTLAENAWYRFRVQYTKLTDSSAQIDVSLQELDAAGVPGSVVVTGTVADTTTWAHNPASDNPSLFSAATMCPSFKNYDQSAIAGADNAYLEIIPEPGTILFVLAGGVLLVRRSR